MKMIYAIVQHNDANNVTDQLNRNGFAVTKFSTTGGFLKRGNVTLVIGTRQEQVQQVMDILKQECGKRKQILYNTPYTGGSPISPNVGVIPVSVDMGGATIFVVDVEQFERI